MSFFRFFWLRNLIRKNTNPIPVDKAALWKNRLAIAYALIAWNAFGFVLYQICSGKGDWATYHGLSEEKKASAGHEWAKLLKIDNAKVYRVEGFSVKEVIDEKESDSQL
ncbi:unnamed protein product [Phyllotreta striolata]|uniref:Uncharacterized protein n=1 Tax=Phyllotreta striolata TaxID=444603 RepID=A0A9N9TRK1_PHYSR|nr:unnamed protein product [Phyllotreta striolata]